MIIGDSVFQVLSTNRKKSSELVSRLIQTLSFRLLLLSLLLHISAPCEASISDRAFIWAGNRYGQFSEEQYEAISRDYAIVVLAKFHGDYDIRLHHEAAAELKRRNPGMRVLIYCSASFWYLRNSFGQEEFQEEWYLHDFKDNWRRDPAGPVRHRLAKINEGEVVGYRVDVTNPEYRSWILGIVRQWMDMTTSDGLPLYDGVAFDAVSLYNADNVEGQSSPRVKRMIRELSGESNPGPDAVTRAVRKIHARNNGMKLLLQEAGERLPEKLIFYNGLAAEEWCIARNVSFMRQPIFADGVLNEEFCYFGEELLSGDRILQDINLMLHRRYSHAAFLLKTNVPNAAELTEEERSHIRRFSYGCFLLGYRPGYTFYKYAEGDVYFVEGNIGFDPSEMSINLGRPVNGRYRMEGKSFVRYFQFGRVYVNLGDTAQEVVVDRALGVASGGWEGGIFLPGDILQLPAMDAVFLIFPD